MEILKNQKLMGQVRHVLTFVAGILVAKGKVSQELIDSILGNLDSVFTAVGVIVGAAAAIWSAKSKAKAPNTPEP